MDSLSRFKAMIERNFPDEDNFMINFVTVDGFKFKHPLYHMGLRESDMPVILVDTFKKMHHFPKKVFDVGEELWDFLEDLGKKYNARIVNENIVFDDFPDHAPKTTFAKLQSSS